MAQEEIRRLIMASPLSPGWWLKQHRFHLALPLLLAEAVDGPDFALDTRGKLTL